MAAILKINPDNPTGIRVLNAVLQIRDGVGILREYDGVRANAIGTSQAEMAAVFGAASNGDAQGLSDRWGALLDALYNPGNAAYTHFALLRDMIEAVNYTTS